MQINCLGCGHKFDLGKNYDDYEGLVKCSTCGVLLDIRTQDAEVRAVRFGAIPGQQLSVEQPSHNTHNSRNAA